MSTVVDQSESPAPDARRSPGYPIFLLPFSFSTILNHFELHVTLAQSLLSTITILFSFLISRHLLGRTGALLVALLTAMSPHQINVNVYILTEALFSFLLMAGLVLISSETRIRKAVWWAAAGLVFGYASLVRPTLQYFIFFLLFYFMMSRALEYRFRLAMSLSLGFIAVLSPWLLRNLVVFGYLSDPSLTTGSLVFGIYPDFMYDNRSETFGIPYRFDPMIGQISSSLGTVLAEISRRFLEQPVVYFSWYLSKPLYLFQWDIIQGLGDAFIYGIRTSPYFSNPVFVVTHDVMRLIHSLLVWSSFIGCAGVFLPRSLTGVSEFQSILGRLFGLLYIYFILVHVAGAPLPRYSIPIRPVTYLLALVPFFWIFPLLFRRSTTPRRSPNRRPA